MKEIQGKSILVRVSKGSSYRDSIVNGFGSNYRMVYVILLFFFMLHNLATKHLLNALYLQ